MVPPEGYNAYINNKRNSNMSSSTNSNRQSNTGFPINGLIIIEQPVFLSFDLSENRSELDQNYLTVTGR
jgi:hypothetical protein